MFDETNLLFSPLRPSKKANAGTQPRQTLTRTVHEELIEDYSSALSVEALVALLKKENISLKVAIATYKKAAAGTPEQLHNELVRLQESEAKLATENARLKSTLRDLELLSNKENIAEYEEEVMRYKSLLKAKEQEITRLVSSLETGKDSQEAENDRLLKIIEMHDADITRLESQLRQSESEMDRLTLENDRLKNELISKRAEFDQGSNSEIISMRSKLSDSKREALALTAELEASTQRNSKLKGQMESSESQLKEQIRSLEYELEASRRQNSSLNGKLDTSASHLQEKIRHLEAQNNSLKSEQKHLTNGLLAARTENDKLMARASSARDELNTIKDQLDAEMKINKEHEVRIEGKNDELKRLRSQLSKQTHQDASNIPLANEINRLHDEINDLKIRLKASEHEAQRLNRDVQAFERDSDESRGQILQLQRENGRLSDECSRLRREASDKSSSNLDQQHELLNQIDLLESKNKDLERKLEQAQHTQRWEAKSNEAESRLIDSESKIARLESERVEMQASVHELELRCDFYEKEYENLKESLELEKMNRQSRPSRDDLQTLSLEEDLRRYRELENQLRTNHETEKTRLQEQVRSTRLKLEEAEFTIEQLLREKRQKQSEIDDLIREVTRYQQSYTNTGTTRTTGSGVSLSELLEQGLTRAKLDAAERDKRKLESDLEDLQRNFKQTLSSENWEKEDLRQKLKKMATERIDLERQVQNAENERDGYKTRLTLQKQELEDLMESAGVMKEKYEKLRRDLLLQQTEAGEATGTLKSKMRKLESTTHELESKLVAEEAKITQFMVNQRKDAQYIEKLKQKIVELKQREQELRAHVTEIEAIPSLPALTNNNNQEAIYYRAKFRDALIHYADCLMMYNFISQEFETFDNWFKSRTIKYGKNTNFLVQVKKPLTFATVAQFVLASVRWRRRAQQGRQRRLKLVELETELEIQDS